jgi:phenol 2-monooxygenase (NADPH)
MLDQLGLADELAQQCFACRTTVSYDPDGNEVQGRGWYFMENMKDTAWDFALVLRQKYQEEIFRKRLREEGVELQAPVELMRVDVLDSVVEGGYRVSATTRDGVSGTTSGIRCKYLIGADGGRSFVRRALDIPFDGSNTEDKWVRIDGMVETDMPKSRSYGAIESKTHGNVLWAPLDHGATRIGFAFTAERQKGHPEFNEAAAVAEAIESVKPFKVSFTRVDWFTVYSVGQKMARNFFVGDCVFLAGDACHTHSSGAAQGMNTGIHDSINLGWKLSLVLRGIAHRSLLTTYESERLPNVQKLINYDKDISRLMTMQLPIGWKGDPNADPNEVLGYVMEEASTFTSGLSIDFNANMLNVQGSFVSATGPSPGQRGPDVQLQKPGTFETTRLHKIMPNLSHFYVVIFVGELEETSALFREFSNAVERSRLLGNAHLPITWVTIPGQSGPSAFELLGSSPLGRVYFDQGQTAHARYGVDVKKGAVVVLRPDGWVGTSTILGSEAVKELETYFSSFLIVDSQI